MSRPTDLDSLRRRLRVDPDTGCHCWTGKPGTGGYGRVRYYGRTEQAHRLVWRLLGRELPADKPHLLHACDNPACCNPDHLFPGTHQENMDDRRRKGRGAKSGRGLPYGANPTTGGKWASQSSEGRVPRYLGTFDTWQEASAIAMLHKNLALFPDVRVN